MEMKVCEQFNLEITHLENSNISGDYYLYMDDGLTLGIVSSFCTSSTKTLCSLCLKCSMPL